MIFWRDLQLFCSFFFFSSLPDAATSSAQSPLPAGSLPGSMFTAKSLTGSWSAITVSRKRSKRSSTTFGFWTPTDRLPYPRRPCKETYTRSWFTCMTVVCGSTDNAPTPLPHYTADTGARSTAPWECSWPGFWRFCQGINSAQFLSIYPENIFCQLKSTCCRLPEGGSFFAQIPQPQPP